MLFEVKDRFYLNGEPFQVISGAVHYFRIVPEYWRDRLEKLKNMGCNTVETYVPWNFHEQKENEYSFTGRQDLCRFVSLSQELGLYMIVRPSPYICSEWEFGGLPAWLLRDRNMRVRCSYPPFLEKVKRYYHHLLPLLRDHQIDRGGNILMMQIENEYGYFGNDQDYLRFLRDTMRVEGITVPLVTSDGPWKDEQFLSGCVEGALPTGNFGSGAEEHFRHMRSMGVKGPMMCMEFWNGWFDAWGEKEHHRTDANAAAKELDEVLKEGSVSIYMLEGGTNFGFTAGRDRGKPTADVTSYDYDAPLTEDGQLTNKYRAFQDVIRKYRRFEEQKLTTGIKRIAYGKVPLTGRVSLFDLLPGLAEPIVSPWPLSMEEAGQNTGYILYRTRLNGEKIHSIQMEGAADRVQIFLDGKPLLTADGDQLEKVFRLEEPAEGQVLDLLIENIGRVNFGTGLDRQRKGLTEGLQVNERRVYGFEIFPFPLDPEQVRRIRFDGVLNENTPAFCLFEFDAEETGDTFLDVDGFAKGCAFLNGFNLGRYWEAGPQRRLYIPGPLLKRGRNKLILLETEGKYTDTVTLTDKPDLG